MTKQLLSVNNLSIDFLTRRGCVKALEDVTFAVHEGEILGIVGESGSGKSVLSYSIMGLSDPAANIRSGSISFKGVAVKPHNMADLRGKEISMVFQSPRTALNPIRKVGHQIEDVLRRHCSLRGKALRSAAIEALARVRIPDPERRYEAYPFEMSGGMCQRVMIAMALACKPSLLIADEPTTGLDVTTQAVIMDLIRELVVETNMAAILITHDLALAGEYCDRIAVMHAGHVVEVAQSNSFPNELKHPYTKRLFESLPSAADTLDQLAVIPGSLPDLRGTLPACRYIARCERAKEDCSLKPLPWTHINSNHVVRCRYPK
ncbi:ABC transporter ATP-binding protein [Pararhizobium sp. DWP3-4]|uniref:ABC transporter ATP-binding protein n=1 Tax=Pararhizobium sp. DWP3-4 TaxID=2804565 RepID=UPI003CF92A90